MAIDPVSSGSGAQTASQNAATRLSADYESFLKLLTAQLSNQDPLEPMDSSMFVTQLAQLSQVEQAITTNTNLETISAQLATAGMLSDMALIGKTVTVPSSKLELAGGEAKFSYALAAPAKSVTAEILTEDGTLVRRLDNLPTDASGLNHMTWDGLDRLGLPVPDDMFKVKITALDSEGEEIGVQAFGKTRVERISFESGLATLELANGDSAYSVQVVSIE